MKTKDYIYICMFLLLGGGIFYFQYNQVEDDEVGRLKRNLEISQQEIKHYKNREGELIAEIESKSYTQKEMKKFEEETLKRIKEIAGDVQSVKQYVKFRSEVRDTVFMVTDSTIYIVNESGQQVDSLPFEYQDKYMDINGEYRKEGVALDYTYKPVYEVVTAWKKPDGGGLFAKNRLMVDVVAENPKEIITQANSVEVDVPRKSFLNSKAFWSGLTFAIGLAVKMIFK